MAKWRNAKSLTQLRNQINAMFPNRSRASDGLVGDVAHASRASDHNPWVKDAEGVGVVTAFDITNDPANGVDCQILSQQLIKDARVKYVIFNRVIWKARTGQWEQYNGPNPHDKHLHISVKPESMDDVSPWLFPALSTHPLPANHPTLKRGDRGSDVRLLQAKLNAQRFTLSEDGVFGFSTQNAVLGFQRSRELKPDGVVGPATWKALLEVE